jgi:hypothetical protein
MATPSRHGNRGRACWPVRRNSYDPHGRIAAQEPGWERVRRGDRLEVPRWKRNQQALDVAVGALFEVPGNRMDTRDRFI